MKKLYILSRRFFIAPVYAQALVYAVATAILVQHANDIILNNSVPGSIIILQSLYVGTVIAVSSAFRMKKTLKPEYWLIFQNALDSCELPASSDASLACKSFAKEVVAQRKYFLYSLALLALGIVLNIIPYLILDKFYWLVLASMYIVISLVCTYDSWDRVHKARALLKKAKFN